MKKYTKTLLLVFSAAILVVGVPFIKTPGSCGITLPLAFTGAILGCGGEKESTQQSDAVVQSIAVASEKENQSAVKVTFVELGSENCIPCRMMKPVLERILKDYSGQVKVLYHDVMTAQGRSEGGRYRIRVIPTQVFLDKDGKEYFRHEGFFPFEEVDKILKQKGVN